MFTNAGAESNCYNLTLAANQTAIKPHQNLMDVMSCRLFKADSSGNLNVGIASGLARVFYPAAKLGGSSICKG